MDNNEEKLMDTTEKKVLPLIKKYYSCFDKAGENFIGMFEADTDMKAMRIIEDAVNNPQAGLSKHPEDYTLFRILEIDMRTGQVIENEVKSIINAKELKSES